MKARQHHTIQVRERQHQAHLQQSWALADFSAKQDKIHYYQCDHLGTPLELVDEEGKIVWEACYKAWGRVLQYDVRQVEQKLRFQGQHLMQYSGA